MVIRMPVVQGYSFGSITVDTTTFTSDIVVLADGTLVDDWWRKEGHELAPDDIAVVLDNPPARLVVGTGAHGAMQVLESTRRACQERGIEIHASPTGHAVTEYNEAVREGASVAACFHLTC